MHMLLNFDIVHDISCILSYDAVIQHELANDFQPH